MQPQGPYLLAGYSAGGLLALETARQLSAAGEDIAANAATRVPASTEVLCPVSCIHAAGHKTCSDFTDPKVIGGIDVKEAAPQQSSIK